MRTAFVFPGQGSQAAGMGRDLYEAFPESRAVFEAADAALGMSLSRLCFEGPDEELALTENTQPAILTVSVAALAALRSRGREAEAFAGHSLGEYSAHVAAGTLAFEDAVRIVRLRGRFMQEAVPVGQGAMAAVLGLDEATVRDVCNEAAQGEVLAPANLNAPGQVVIAGTRAAVERAMEMARKAGARKVVPLPVSAPFHCALMEPAARKLEAVLEETPFRDPERPVYANVDARPVRDADRARRTLVRQVAAPVRWEETIRNMAGDGVQRFVEVGPGRVLQGLIRRIAPEAAVMGVADPKGLQRFLEEEP